MKRRKPIIIIGPYNLSSLCYSCHQLHLRMLKTPWGNVNVASYVKHILKNSNGEWSSIFIQTFTISGALPCIPDVSSFFPGYFSSVWRISFSNLFWTGLLAMNSFSFLPLRMPLFRLNFWRIFSLDILLHVDHSFLSALKKSCATFYWTTWLLIRRNLQIVTLKIIYCTLLASFKTLSLFFSLIIMYLGRDFFTFIMFGLCWTWLFLSFAKSKTFH